jgi:hypothetical protein
MQTRHRIPTVFNLSMVDVLCCALGCVILLWLVNFREAKRRAKAAGETVVHLAETRTALDATRRALNDSQTREQQLHHALEETQKTRDRAQKLALAASKDADDTHAALQTALADIAGLRKDLKALQGVNVLLTEELAKKTKDFSGLGQRLTSANTSIRDLEKQLQAQMALLASAGAQVQDLTARLKVSDAEIAALRRQAAQLMAEGKVARDKLAAADTRTASQDKDLDKLRQQLADANRRYQDLLASGKDLDRQVAQRAKEVADARVALAELKLEKQALEQQVRRARQAADNRFAGIELTGRRVIFLVDMSGSMDLIDLNQPAPDKWPLVCETVSKIMKSLPELTEYQVLLFSDKVTYALGNKGRWIRYDKETSARTVHAALRGIKPEGGTNMAAAFAEAFQFRSQGLDTIYVMSDGLPNAGDGLPPGAAKLSEQEKTAYCSKYVRQMLKDVWNRRASLTPAVRINAVGFFFESPDVGAFLWAMAREHNGSFVGMSRP